MSNTRNRFASRLPSDQERKRRLYLLDSDPLHSLQVFGVPQYLPKTIYGYNSITPTDLLKHHERVRELVSSGQLDLTKFDEDGLESSLAFVFGIDVPAKTSDEPPTKIRCLQLYFAAPAVDDVPKGVFGSTEGPDKSNWTELERPAGQNRTWQHSQRPRSEETTAAGGGAKTDGAGTAASAADDEDGPTRGNTPERECKHSP
jgi:hypothetical protein